MKTTFPFSVPLMIGAVALAAPLASVHAQIPWATEPFSRQNKVEFYGIGEYLHEFGDSNVKLNDTGLGGIGVAWHFNDYLSVHGDFLLGPAGFDSNTPGAPWYTQGGDAFIQSSRFNLDYNIINRRMTPFLTAGIGYQYLQVDQEYYEYHHGYYYYEDYWYSEADFTWNVGGGIRWNITDNLFVKATVGAQWLEYQDANKITTQLGASLAIGVTIP